MVQSQMAEVRFIGRLKGIAKAGGGAAGARAARMHSAQATALAANGRTNRWALTAQQRSCA